MLAKVRLTALPFKLLVLKGRASSLSNQLKTVTLFPVDSFCALLLQRGMAYVETYKEFRCHEKNACSISAMFIDMRVASILR
jgi:hypothetical protein